MASRGRTAQLAVAVLALVALLVTALPVVRLGVETRPDAISVDGLPGPLDPWMAGAPGANQVIVGFSAGRVPAIEPGQALAGMAVLARIPQIDVLVLQAPDVAVAQSLLAAVPDITFVEADGAVQATGIPNDARFAGQYGPTLTGFPVAWSQAGFGASSVTVAIIDSGILRSHPDFQGSSILPGHDYVNRDAVPNDDCGHGTHVSGIVGANTNNSIGIAGEAQATLLPLKVLGSGCSGSVSNIAKAIVDATGQDADIIVMSFGTLTASSALASAVGYAWDHGATLVAAAGNEGRDNAVHYPAAYAQVIAVSAVDSSKALAGYSSRGPQVDVAAPGTNIDSTTSRGAYGLMSGTSMSAPHVAGALALALSCAPATTNQQLRVALEATAEDLGAAGRDNRFGHGLVRADLLVQRLCDGIAAPTAPPASPPPLPTPGQTFNATFTIKSPNEWWQQVIVAPSPARTVATVDARIAGGTWEPMTKSSWGAWTLSRHAPANTTVEFLAKDPAGATSQSAVFYWMDGTTSRQNVDPGTTPPPSPTTSPTSPPAPTSPPPSTSPTPPAATNGFTALFAPAKGCNEWWIEVTVSSNSSVATVSASANGGAWRALPKTSWGAWAASFYVAKGSSVVFQATNALGETARSSPQSWLDPATAPTSFTAIFTPKTLSNPWWVEVAVDSGSTVVAVDVRFDAGPWTALPRTDWGTWAKSIHVLPGTHVAFRATEKAGQVANSAIYTWK